MSTQNGMGDSSLSASQDTSEIIARWLEDLKVDRAERTVARYASVLQRFAGWYEQETRCPLAVRDLNPLSLLATAIPYNRPNSRVRSIRTSRRSVHGESG